MRLVSWEIHLCWYLDGSRISAQAVRFWPTTPRVQSGSRAGRSGIVGGAGERCVLGGCDRLTAVCGFAAGVDGRAFRADGRVAGSAAWTDWDLYREHDAAGDCGEHDG